MLEEWYVEDYWGHILEIDMTLAALAERTPFLEPDYGEGHYERGDASPPWAPGRAKQTRVATSVGDAAARAPIAKPADSHTTLTEKVVDYLF